MYRRIFKLPKLTPDGCRVTMSTLVTGDVDKYEIGPAFRLVLAYEDIRLNTDPFCMGNYLVVDAKLFTATHFLRVNPIMIRDFVYCAQVNNNLILFIVYFVICYYFCC